jgi:hypothetical protein
MLRSPIPLYQVREDEGITPKGLTCSPGWIQFNEGGLVCTSTSGS